MSEKYIGILVTGGFIVAVAIYGSVNIEVDYSEFFQLILAGVGIVIGMGFIGLLALGWEKITGREFEGNNILYFIIAVNAVAFSLIYFF